MTNRIASTSAKNSSTPAPAARVASSLCRAARRAGAPLAALTVVGGLLCAPKVASAQEWLKDRRYGEGAGIRVGDLDLHPGIGGEVGYDSNYFLRTQKTGARLVNGAPQNAPVESGELRVTPSFSVSTLSVQRLEGTAPPVVAFRAGAAATYREFLGPQEVRDQRNVSGNAFARLDVNSGKPLGFGIFANYQRLIQPSVVSDPNRSFNRSDVNAGAEVIALPGGGALDMRAGYQALGALFEESNGVPFTSITHELSVRNRWRFRPRTALFHDTSLRFVSYPNKDRALNYLNDSAPLRTRFGITGLLTDRFGVLAAAGYGATFFQKGNLSSTSQYDSLNAQAEGTFYLSQSAGAGEPGQATLLLSAITFGFLRDFQNSLLGNYYTSDKGYAKITYFFGGKVFLSLDGYFEALDYPQPFYNAGANGIQPVNGPNGTPTGAFTNFHVGGTLFGEYRFTDSFGVNATFKYEQTLSDTQIEAGAGPTPGSATQLYDLNWRQVQAFIGARWFL